MKELQRFFETYHSDEGRATYKLKSYEPIYETFLVPFVGRDVTLVELGIGYGGSLQMWRAFLGSLSHVYGIDKNIESLYSDLGITCIQGDTASEEFISSIPSLIPVIDIFIDDGSHISSHQIATFESVFPSMREGGIYFCEDTHTSYRSQYGGGYKKIDSFIEYCKGIVDGLHRLETESIKPVSFISEIESITFYSSLVMVKKK